MSSEDDVILMTFPTKAQAEELVQLLTDAGIPARVSIDENNASIAMQVNVTPNKFQLIVHSQQLEKAKAVFQELA